MLKKIKIVADKNIPFLFGVLEPYAEILYLNHAQINKENVKDADALLVRTRTRCSESLLVNSSVKFIGTATIGFDHVDTEFCESEGIKWVNAPGCNSGSVQQYMSSALLTLAKLKDIQLNSKTIGIIGVGNVGSKVEKIASTFEMKTLLNDPPRERNEGSKKFVPLNRLMEESDIIIIHAPLNVNGIDKTYHLIDEELFRKLEKGKVFINTSRGEIVDTKALKNIIRCNKVNSCVLDVWENEPSIDTELLSLVDLATPHIAGHSVEGKANGISVCINSLNEYFNLGLDQYWYPKNIPNPVSSKVIKIDCSGKTDQQILFEIITSTYDITEDDKRLRKSVLEFEKQRIDYPTRREFNYYQVTLKNASEFIIKSITELGFKLI